MEHNVPDNIFHNQLLALATSAKGDEPMDPTVKPMAEEDRKWLRNVLQEYVSDSDPIKRLKNVLSSLEALLPAESTTSGLIESDDAQERLRTIVDDELIDLICDMDLALDFCKLGGLQIVRRLLTGQGAAAAVDASLLGVVAEIAQNNPAVQECIVKEEFLIPHCLRILGAAAAESSAGGEAKPVDSDKDMAQEESRRRIRAVGALSAIIRGYIPAAGKFARLNGPRRFVEFFEWALRRDDEPLVHRCAVAAGGIANSFKPEVATALKANEMANAIREKLETADSSKYEEALNFLRS